MKFQFSPKGDHTKTDFQLKAIEDFTCTIDVDIQCFLTKLPYYCYNTTVSSGIAYFVVRLFCHKWLVFVAICDKSIVKLFVSFRFRV